MFSLVEASLGLLQLLWWTSVLLGHLLMQILSCSRKAHLLLLWLQELSEEIEDYTQRFNTEDQLEWSLVLQEVAAFVEVTGSPRLHVQPRTRSTLDTLCPAVCPPG